MEDTYKYRSGDVAIYMIAYANENKIYINMTKTQKLLYVAYGTYLAVKDKLLINEKPYAWPSGAVFQRVREILLNEDFHSINLNDCRIKELRKDKEFNKLIKLVFDTLGKKTMYELVTLSTSENTAWYEVTNGSRFGDMIPDKLTKDYFSKIIK